MPGEVAGLYEAWRTYGRLDWGLLFQPVISLCEEGFTVERALAGAIKSHARHITNDPSLGYTPLFVLAEHNLMCESLQIIDLQIKNNNNNNNNKNTYEAIKEPLPIKNKKKQFSVGS